MKLDQKRLKRQIQCFENWVALGIRSPVKVTLDGVETDIAAGIIEAATGFGKTYLAVMTIQKMLSRFPDRKTIIVVPTTKLYDDWTRTKQVFNGKGEVVLDFGHIIKHKLSNVRVFVVNTYVKYVDYEADLLILDEAHHYAGIDADHFNKVLKITKYRFGMGLSATLTKAQKDFFARFGWKIVDVVSPEECEREGYTTSSITFNLGIPLSPMDEKFNDEINDRFREMFKKFDFEFELMRACQVGNEVAVTVKLSNGGYIGKKTGREWREWFAKKRRWDGDASHPWSPQNIQRYAAMGMNYMRKRKDKWQNMPSKLVYVEQIVKKFSNLKTIIFSETGDFADKVAARFPESCLPYHTNLATLAIKGAEIIENPTREQTKELRKQGYAIKGKTVRKREALEAFIDPKSKINQISAVRALDEGVDVPKVELILQTAYSSTERQNTQREGRGKRIDYDNLDKKALLINLYMIGTQEEKWLRSKQAGKRMVRWVDSVDEISINHKISLYAPITEAPAVEAGGSSDHVEHGPATDEGVES